MKHLIKVIKALVPDIADIKYIFVCCVYCSLFYVLCDAWMMIRADLAGETIRFVHNVFPFLAQYEFSSHYSLEVLILLVGIFLWFGMVAFAYVKKIVCWFCAVWARIGRKMFRMVMRFKQWGSPRLYRFLSTREASSRIYRCLKKYLYKRVERKNGIPIKPLAPVDNAIGIDGYERMMTSALKDNHIRNIAVVGRYGAGKSSFLRTYFQDHNVIWVSLASFVEEQCQARSSNKNIKNQEKFYQRLEQSILQQLLYNARQKDIPHSRFNRILKDGLYDILMVCTFIVFLIGDFIMVWQPDRFMKKYEFDAQTGQRIHILGLLLGVILVVWSVLLLRKYFLRFRPKVSVSLKGVDFGINHGEGVSVFNKSIDELIYYFEVLKYDAVIFEDIDRFNNPLLYAKLRELNQILNESKQIPWQHKPIKFIYALREDVFSCTMRVKFFDFILPIFPYFNFDISQGQITKDISDIIGGALTEEWHTLIRCFAPYIDDMRFWNHICNEFKLCNSFCDDDLAKRKWLAMVIFKNYFPKEFDLAHEHNGVLALVFDQHIPHERAVEVKKGEIAKLQEKMASYAQETAQSLECLVQEYFVKGLLPVLPEMAKLVEINGEQYTLTEISKVENFEKLVGNEFSITYTLFNIYRGCTEDRFISVQWQTVENTANKGGSSYVDRRKVILARNEGGVEACNEEIRRLQDEVESIALTPIADLISREDIRYNDIKMCFGDKYSNESAISVFYKFLEIGVIDEHYVNYITQYANRSISPNDAAFIQDVLTGKDVSHYGDLDNPNLVLSKLGELSFSKYSIYNSSLAKCLIRAYAEAKGNLAIKVKMKKMADSLLVWEDRIAVMTMANVLSVEDDYTYKDRWFKLFTVQDELFEKNLMGCDVIGVETKNTILIDYIGYAGRRKEFNIVSDEAKQFIAEFRDLSELCASSLLRESQLLDLVIRSGIQFATDAFVKVNDKRLVDRVIHEGAFRLNKVIVNALLKYKNAPEKMVERRPYGAVLRFCPEILGPKYARTEEFILNIYETTSSYGRCAESSEDIIRVIQDERVSTTVKREFLEAQRTVKLDIIDAFSNNTIEFLLDMNSINPSIGELCRIYKKVGYSESLRGFVRNHYSRIYGDTAITVDDVSPLLGNLIEDETLDDSIVVRIGRRINGWVGYAYKYTGVKVGRSRMMALGRARLVQFSEAYYSKLKGAGRGAHFGLAGAFVKKFLEEYRDEWLDYSDAAALLQTRPGEDRPVEGIILLRNAIGLLSVHEDLRAKLGGYARLSDFNRKGNIFSLEQSRLMVDYVADSNCRARIVCKMEIKDEAWQHLILFPKAEIDQNRKIVCFRLHICEANMLCSHLNNLGMKASVEAKPREPMVTIEYNAGGNSIIEDDDKRFWART